MYVKSIYILLGFLLLFSKAKSQLNNERTTCCCSTIIRQLSDGWKKDSLRSKGFRFSNYKKLLTCKIDTVSLNFITIELGKPQSIGSNKSEIEYRYSFFDMNTLSKKHLEDIIGIILRFDKMTNKFLETELILNDF